jgi:hypothetical protein
MRKIQLFFFIVFVVYLTGCNQEYHHADFLRVFGYYQNIHRKAFNVTKDVEDSISNFLVCYNDTCKLMLKYGNIHYRYFIGSNDLTYKGERHIEIDNENATGIIFKETLDDPSLGRLMDSIVFIGNQTYIEELKQKAAKIGFSYIDSDSTRMSYSESWYVEDFPYMRIYLLTFEKMGKIQTATLTYNI